MPVKDSTKGFTNYTFYPAKPRKDLTGNRIGKLTIKFFLGRTRTIKIKRIRWRYFWIAVCDCGNILIVDASALRGNTNSCGCLQLATVLKHGKWQHAEYQTWSGMTQRCYNPNDANYLNYGGRGITVCDKWRHSFEAFYADVGPKPFQNYSLDRIDNNGNYSPENVRWASPKEQAANRRISYSPEYLITYNGVTKNMKDWATSIGLKHGRCLVYRLRRGWSLDDAFTRPPYTKDTKKMS